MRAYWAYRHPQDIVDVVRWLVESDRITRSSLEAFLERLNGERDRVSNNNLGLLQDSYGRNYARRFSTRLEDIESRHPHDLISFLEVTVRNNAVLEGLIVGKLSSFNIAQSALRAKLRSSDVTDEKDDKKH